MAPWISGAVEMSLLEPDIADAAVVLAGALALWLGRRGRWWAAALAVAVGVSAHELALAFAVGLVMAAWPVRRRRSVALLLPSLAVYATLHFTPLLYGHMVAQFPTLSVANLRSVYALQAFRFGRDWLLVAAAGAVWTAMGVLWLLLPFGWRRAPRYYRGMTAAMPVAALPCVLVADWPRVLGVAALTLVPVVCFALPRSRDRVEDGHGGVADARGPGVVQRAVGSGQ